MKEKNQILLLKMAVLFGLFFMFQSCDNASSTATATTEVPELIDRNERIQNGKEWDQIQNQYQSQKVGLASNPENMEARLTLANIFVREARATGEHGHYYPAALQMTDEILASNPEDDDLKFRTLVIKAGVELSLHEFETAKETGLEAYKLNPMNAQINGVLADCYVEMGDYKQAIVAADQMAQIKPDLRSYSRVSYLREIHGDIDGAVEALNLAVESGYPGTEETAWAMLTLGNLYKQYGQFDKAEKVYEAILASREDYPFAIGELADVYYQKGDLAKAEELLDDAVTIIPEVGFYTQLAQIYKDQGRDEEYNTTMEEVFVMLEDDVVHGHNMNLEYAHIYLDLAVDHDKAMEYAQKEYKKRPRNIDINRVMAQVYMAMGQEGEAKKYIEAASITESQNPELLSLQKKINYEANLSSL